MRLIATKTFWGGVALVATGIGQLVSGDLYGGLQSIAAGLTAIFVRDAIDKMQ